MQVQRLIELQENKKHKLYFFLEEKGFDVLLANAKDVKNVSGKKTDEADAEWIMLMHSYGLLKPSFHPDAAAREIRELARHRDNMLRSAGKEIQHMQKSLVLMNIKVDTVISDILGKSGKAIIEAILAVDRGNAGRSFNLNYGNYGFGNFQDYTYDHTYTPSAIERTKADDSVRSVNRIYTLDGRQMSTAQKGINIINGKKMMTR